MKLLANISVIGILIGCIAFAPVESSAQVYIGLGPSYAIPIGDFSETNGNAFGGTLVVGTRRYCHLWFGMRLDYVANQPVESPELRHFTDAFLLSPEFRWFPAKCTDIPFYVQGMLSVGGIQATDDTGLFGFGGGAGIGFLLPYSTNCSWFLDINARLMAPNFIAKDDARPTLLYPQFNVTFNFGL